MWKGGAQGGPQSPETERKHMQSHPDNSPTETLRLKSRGKQLVGRRRVDESRGKILWRKQEDSRLNSVSNSFLLLLVRHLLLEAMHLFLVASCYY